MAERTCSVEGCERKHRAKGWCSKHYYVLRRDLCIHDGCGGPRKARGFCARHDREFSEVKRLCPECGLLFSGHARRKYCSVWCKSQAGRSPVRKAVEAGDADGVIAAARASSMVTTTGCWEWQFATSPAGYPMIGQGGSGSMVHRHVAQAALGRPIGSEPVHHKCANPRCVNPEHLQITTTRENTAEMMTRTYLTRRIAALEAALMLHDPSHPLLASVTETSTAS